MRQGEVALRATLIALAVVAASGCTKEKRPAPPPAATAAPATLSSMQTDIFALSCAVSGCHDNRANPAGQLSMSSVQATYAGLVNRNSTEAVNLKLVAPADPDHSYLVDKLTGTHLLVGGTGRQMPQDAAPLSSDDINRIINWINDGAQVN